MEFHFYMSKYFISLSKRSDASNSLSLPRRPLPPRRIHLRRQKYCSCRSLVRYGILCCMQIELVSDLNSMHNHTRHCWYFVSADRPHIMHAPRYQFLVLCLDGFDGFKPSTLASLGLRAWKIQSPKSGNVTNIVWNVVDKSLSTLFKKSAMHVRFGQSIVQNVVHNLAMKVMYSAMVYMYNAIKVIDNAMINITYA
jgi:hypothetical protein